MTKYVRINLVLPDYIQKKFDEFRLSMDKDSRNALIKKLYAARWTLESISEAADLTRERVRQVVLNPALEVEFDFEMPEPPKKPERVRRVYPEPNSETLARLLVLQPLAQLVRSNKKDYRVESEEYTRLLWKAYKEEGVSLYRLAQKLGVTHAALRFRLTRYGYMPSSPTAKSRVYKPINPANRIK